MVVKNQAVGNAGLHHNALGCLIEDVTCRCSGFRHHDGTARLQSGDNHCAVRSGFVDTVGGADSVALAVPDNKFSVCQRLAGHSVSFRDGQCGLGGVGDNDRLRVSVGADDHVGAGAVHDVTVRGFDFRQYIGSRSEIADPDFTLGIGSKNAVGSQSSGADHAVQTYLTASGGGHPELSAGQDLVGLTVPFLDDQFSSGLVFHGHSDHFSCLNHNGLRLGINEESRRGLGLGDDYAPARGQALDPHLAVFVRTVNTVAVANEAAVRVGHLKLRIRQCNTGVDTAHLPNEEGAGGLVAELQGDGLACIDDSGLGYVVQDVAVLGSDLFHDQRRAGVDTADSEAAGAVRHKLTVGVADDIALAVSDQKFNVRKRLFCDGIHLFHQKGALGAVSEMDLNNLLIVAGEVHGLGRGVNHMVAIAGQLLNDIGASGETSGREGAVLSGAVGADHGAACPGSVAGEVADLEHRPLNGHVGADTVILPNANGRQGPVLEQEGMASTRGDERLLGVGVGESEAVGRFQLLHPEPAVPEEDVRLGEYNAAIFVRIMYTQVVVLAGAGVVGGIPDLEGHVGLPLMGDGIFLDNLDGRPLVVLKENLPILVGIEGHKLVGRVLEVGLRDGFLRNFVHAGEQILQSALAVRAGLDLVDAVAVCGLHQENRVGDDLAGVRVPFPDDEVGPLVVLHPQLGGLVGEQLYMVLGLVQNMVGQGGSFHHGVHTRLQILYKDLTAVFRGAVNIPAAVLDFGNAEGNAIQRSSVCACLNQAETGLFVIAQT